VLARLDWPLTDAALPAAGELVEQVVEEVAARYVLGPGPAAQAAAAREIAFDVRRLLAHEARAGGAFVPAELELSFGMDPDGTPALELGEGALRLRGQIDRVDLDAAGRALVRDYKSGRRSPSWPIGRWEADDQLQIALYMIAVRELLGREPVGGVYQPLRGEDLRARGVVRDDAEVGALVVETDVRPREELEAALEHAAARACELAAALLAGVLHPRPETCTPAGGCAHPGICRVPDA